MNLAQALRLPPASSVAFVGAGGKSTALFQLARELNPPVIITATTHLGALLDVCQRCTTFDIASKVITMAILHSKQ